MEQFLIGQIIEVIKNIELYVDNVETLQGTRKITEYMNIEHGIGKYHAFMECLEEINIDKWIELHTRYESKINKALEKLETLYH